MSVAVTAAAAEPNATVTVDGLTVGTDATVTVQRAWSGKTADVRGAVDAAVTGGEMTFTDYECPFVPVSYAVTVRDAAGAVTAQGSSGPVTLVADRPWISDPLNPRTACQVRFHGDAVVQLDYQQPGDALQPLGSAVPVAIVGTRMVGGNIPLDLLCLTLGERMQVLAVLQSAAVVCLRVPAKDQYSMLPPLCYVQAPTVSELPLSVQYGGAATRISWTGQLVRAPATPIIVPTRTYADLLDEAGSYADLLTLYGSYNALLMGG